MDNVKTRQNLIDEAAENLGVLSAGQVLASEDSTKIDSAIDPLLNQLAADEVVYIDDPEEIPAEYFLPLGRLLANVCGPKYGSAINRDAKLADEMELRRLTRAKPTYEPAQPTYF